MAKKNAISPTRKEDYPNWYQAVVKEGDLAENSPVRGCMVIKPWGYGIWENIQAVLNKKIKDSGHQNAYFPLFIPLSFMQKEAEHVEGFAKECAVVTHHRLENKDGKLIPAGELEEPLIVRPTSEMIIGEMFSKWVESYRDLPIKINQWANIVRWEMRTRLFLRTTEFLWQEGHTVHSTEEEAVDEVFDMLNMYKNFCHDYLAMPVLVGSKSEMEKFPGAVDTYCIEAMMQDKKALQAGTSHFLGQNFSKSCDIKFSNENGQLEYGWTTSWGVATRLIGALVMTHSDDDGLILPPKIAPSQIVILPIIHSKDVEQKVLTYCENLRKDLMDISYHGKNLEVIIDKRDLRGGEKKWSWVKKGIPLQIEIGPRDIEKDSLFVSRRDTLKPMSVVKSTFLQSVIKWLDDIQDSLYTKALAFQKDNTFFMDNEKEFYEFFNKNVGFVEAYFCLDDKLENKIKEDLGVSVRCILLDEKDLGDCIFTKKSNQRKVIFAKAY